MWLGVIYHFLFCYLGRYGISTESHSQHPLWEHCTQMNLRCSFHMDLGRWTKTSGWHRTTFYSGNSFSLSRSPNFSFSCVRSYITAGCQIRCVGSKKLTLDEDVLYITGVSLASFYQPALIHQNYMQCAVWFFFLNPCECCKGHCTSQAMFDKSDNGSKCQPTLDRSFKILINCEIRLHHRHK